MSAATYVGLLSDDQRLRVFAAVALGATTVDAVVEATNLSAEDVRAVLPRLVTSGLVDAEAGLRVRTESLDAAARARPARERGLPGATPEQAAVLRNFAEDGRLVRLPARAGPRRVVLDYVAGRFEPGRDYAEAEVNALLSELHDDHVTLRRLLVDEGLLERASGIYRRV